ncbi:phage tail tape measure protein [Shigella boydii]|uniref:phage tail tape measure protein n=1 Tax=Shigella boydii TaxID=621 RepID=UPI00253FF233|nr:phage tail tape measure protein [Shigella boydii]
MWQIKHSIQLRKTSQTFAINYGESASNFVRSAYDIQSAIAGLQGDELPKFTEASAILAKATKSDTATITNYMGTMYGVFKNTAEKMGRTQWVEQIAGQTATAFRCSKLPVMKCLLPLLRWVPTRRQ